LHVKKYLLYKFSVTSDKLQYFVVERYGFRRQLSTANGTRWLAYIILNVWYNNRYIVGVLCDRTKLFVCANHELSLKQTTTLYSQRQTLRSV